MNGQQEVYVRVVNEDVADWRPVKAERMSGEHIDFSTVRATMRCGSSQQAQSSGARCAN
jgi:hypothetical protein